MQDNPNTDNAGHSDSEIDIDRDDWEFALNPYEGDPRAALLLGFNVAILRAYLDAQTIEITKKADSSALWCMWYGSKDHKARLGVERLAYCRGTLDRE